LNILQRHFFVKPNIPIRKPFLLAGAHDIKWFFPIRPITKVLIIKWHLHKVFVVTRFSATPCFIFRKLNSSIVPNEKKFLASVFKFLIYAFCRQQSYSHFFKEFQLKTRFFSTQKRHSWRAGWIFNLSTSIVICLHFSRWQLKLYFFFQPEFFLLSRNTRLSKFCWTCVQRKLTVSVNITWKWFL
jgi:hypothetical protein